MSQVMKILTYRCSLLICQVSGFLDMNPKMKRRICIKPCFHLYIQVHVHIWQNFSGSKSVFVSDEFLPILSKPIYEIIGYKFLDLNPVWFNMNLDPVLDLLLSALPTSISWMRQSRRWWVCGILGCFESKLVYFVGARVWSGQVQDILDEKWFEKRISQSNKN